VLNGDSLIDVFAIAMMNMESKGRVYLNDNKGHFQYTGQPLGQGILAAVEMGDVNGDGFIDAVLSGWRNADADPCPNRVLLNDGQGNFSDSKLRMGADWSWEVAVGDVNKDGLRDLFVVNLGVDRTAPPEKMMKGRFAEVWLNTSQKKRP
jgi:hypothetical protein